MELSAKVSRVSQVESAPPLHVSPPSTSHTQVLCKAHLQEAVCHGCFPYGQLSGSQSMKKGMLGDGAAPRGEEGVVRAALILGGWGHPDRGSGKSHPNRLHVQLP